MPSHQGAEALSASGRSSEKLSLPTLQSKMKSDPDGYESELILLYSQFKSSLELFQQQAALNFTSISGIGSDPSVAKDLGDRALILAHVTPFYPNHLADFPKQLAGLLSSASRSLPSGLRCHVAQSLILLSNRQMIDIEETLALFMDLQTLGDKPLRKLAFSHVIHSIKRMNQKHKNDAKNRKLQNIVFAMLQQDDEAKAKRALTTLCELHRRKLWFDDRTANAIATACFHSSPRIMIAALSFLLDYEKIEDDDDSDASSGEDDPNPQAPHVVINKQAIYNAHHKGTVSSKKKKQAKLQRAMRSMKRQQRLSSENVSSNNYSPLNHLKDAQAHHKGTVSSKKKKQAKLQRAMRSMKRQQRLSSENVSSNNYSPLNHLKDAQGFVEKLFSRLQTCNERFEVRMMMLKVIARTVGLHRLILLNFYHFIEKYVQPHQRDVTSLLAAAVQACHDMVPPDAVEPLFRKIVNQFVHDRSRPEAIAVGLNVIREICLRMPLLMTEDLLQDLALYKKSHEKAVSIAARSLITLFREVCPSLLIKKDPTNCSSKTGDVNARDSETGGRESKAKKRKLSDFDGQLLAADSSLRALKRLAGVTMGQTSPDSTDGILSNEDFQRIKELKAKKDANDALVKHGLRKGIPSSDQLSTKRVDPAKLEVHVRKKMSKEERLALVRAGREDRGKYQARTSVKQKKTGGLSNRQKERKKNLPMAAKKAKVARSQLEKKKKQQRAGKQFRGRKAWK
ncbi:protein sda1 like protein [Quercus suber]|uniref:Protein SDA1 n=1 Tax=Quercus suber TaxID=58331 RepID=A0AAW0IYF2_QUESU